MANKKHLKILKQGVEVWNQWREENPHTRPDLSGANLRYADLSGANLRYADLSKADLRGADLHGAYLAEADLGGANLREANLNFAHLSYANLWGVNLKEAQLGLADLRGAELSEADLREANLREANLHDARLNDAKLQRADFSDVNLDFAQLIRADLREADLSGAHLSKVDIREAKLGKASLRRASLVTTNLSGANLEGCNVFGVSAWKVNLRGANQSNLIISDYGEPVITVDNLEVAQFMYLLLHNEKIRHIIDTVTSKVVLILGRFTPERKKILDAIRDELRRRDYLPLLFDFEKPSSRDLTETISTLAHMARFVIADITDAKSIPAELERIVPGLPSVPVQPLIATSDEYALFEHIRRFPWVLEPYQYDDLDGLLNTLKEKVIDPAELRAKQIKEEA
jgi:uncharacterized protein YjbI with pentapeptide repeats